MCAAMLVATMQLVAQVPDGPSVRLVPEPRVAARPVEPPPAGDMVLVWNEEALRAIRDDNTTPPMASRNLAMVHGAVYDAVNSLRRTHSYYLIDARPNPESRAILGRLLAQLRRLARPLGFRPVPGLVKTTPFGFHGHLAGTLPMRAAPGPLESDPLGRLAGTARVFVVDPAAFPTLPAQNLTFTAMANARRVAHGIARALQKAPDARWQTAAAMRESLAGARV